MAKTHFFVELLFVLINFLNIFIGNVIKKVIQSLFTIFDFFPKTKKNGTFRKSAHITLRSGGLDLKLFAFSK